MIRVVSLLGIDEGGPEKRMTSASAVAAVKPDSETAL